MKEEYECINDMQTLFFRFLITTALMNYTSNKKLNTLNWINDNFGQRTFTLFALWALNSFCIYSWQQTF